MDYDSIIIGGGAAGLYCARTAGWRGRKILVLEHNREIGAKILISGGGTVQFHHIHTAPDRFISANPHFCRSALARHPPDAFVTLVRRYGIAYYEKTLGQLFCEGAGAANKIVALLADNPPDVHIRTGCTVTDISPWRRISRGDQSGRFHYQGAGHRNRRGPPFQNSAPASSPIASRASLV